MDKKTITLVAVGLFSFSNAYANTVVNYDRVQTSGNYTFSTLRVGSAWGGVSDRTGSFDIQGGIVNTDDMYVSDGYDAKGTIYLRNDAVLNVSDYFKLGSTGTTARFYHYGGDLNAHYLSIGYTNTTDYYNFYEGKINSYNTTLQAKGYFNQSGGAHIVDNDLSFGKSNYSSPQYHLTGGTLHVKGNILEYNSSSLSSTSYFYINGGTLTHDGSLSGIDNFYIGNSENSEYALNGTFFQVENMLIGGTSTTGKFTINDTSIPVEISKNLQFNKKAHIEVVKGSNLSLTGSLKNYIQDPDRMNDFNNLSLTFEGGSEDFNPFEVGGKDLGNVDVGTVFNFAMDTLTLGGADIGKVRLVDSYDNQLGWDGNEALYVDALILQAGSYLDLNGLNIYYNTLEDYGGTILYNGGELVHYTTVIPEPMTLILLVCSVTALYLRRL